VPRRFALAIACAGLACAFDPTGVTLAGDWDASASDGWCAVVQFSLTQRGDSIFGTATALVPYYSFTPDTVTYHVKGTQYGADIAFVAEDACNPRPMRARLTAADRFVVVDPGTDFMAYETYRRRSP